ncbi:MAG: hypothetical protein JW807_11815 [Spirochaetes bacterium]|nr:hypothetical protein [Spirochaetota bacterium]
MNKAGLLLLLTGAFIFLSNPFDFNYSPVSGLKDNIVVAQFNDPDEATRARDGQDYSYPDFYRGMYLTVNSANNLKKLRDFVAKARSANINTMVLDVQSGKRVKCMVPESNVRYCIDNGIHPVARVVVFPDGLRNYPVPENYLEDRIDIAEDACKKGFREIQFDYIRFHDSGSTRHLTFSQRYKYIEDILTMARNRVKKYNVKIAADVFGRIPLNKNDIIGQNMESLDRVVDLICPMAYPSHYTWSRKFYANPYYTVHETSVKAKNRTRNAEIVTYIQAFKMKMSGIPFEKYIADQIKAVHDSGIKGYIMWNARQDYDIPLSVVKSYYTKSISRKEKHESSVFD